MQEAALVLLGRHDFSAFRSAGCSAQHAIREVTEINVSRQGEFVRIDITANAFLYHMVRNIVGTLIPVGKGEKSVQWFAGIFHGKDRKRAGVTAEPQGLCLLSVRYDPKYNLPDYDEPLVFS